MVKLIAGIIIGIMGYHIGIQTIAATIKQIVESIQ